MIDESLKNLQFAEVANISKRLYSLYCGDGRGKNSRPAHAALGEPERVLANSKNPTLFSVQFFWVGWGCVWGWVGVPIRFAIGKPEMKTYV